MPLGAQAIAALLGGGISALISAGQKRKGHEILKDIGDSPIESVPNEVLQNQQQAQLMANVGLPSQQYNQAMKNIQRQQLIALSRANDRRGGLLTIAGNQQMANDATARLDAADAAARTANQKGAMVVNNQVAGWKDKVWKNNVLDKWNRKYQYAQSLIGSGNMNATNGLDRIAGGGLLGYNNLVGANPSSRSTTGVSGYDYSGSGGYGTDIG